MKVICVSRNKSIAFQELDTPCSHERRTSTHNAVKPVPYRIQELKQGRVLFINQEGK